MREELSFKLCEPRLAEYPPSIFAQYSTRILPRSTKSFILIRSTIVFILIHNISHSYAVLADIETEEQHVLSVRAAAKLETWRE